MPRLTTNKPDCAGWFGPDFAGKELKGEKLKQNAMGRKSLKIVYAVFMALVLIALVAFMILQCVSGQGTYTKIYVVMYALLILWASFRLYSLIKDIIGMK